MSEISGEPNYIFILIQVTTAIFCLLVALRMNYLQSKKVRGEN